MPPRKRNTLLPRRRRHDDDDGEDDSTLGDGETYESSEASLGSDVEGDDNATLDSADEDNNTTSVTPSPVIARAQAQSFKTSADTQAMMYGIPVSATEKVEELNYEETAARSASADGIKRPQYGQRTKSAQNLQTRQRFDGRNPAQVKKGQNLHDSRHAPVVGEQYASRGKGRSNYTQPYRGHQVQRTNSPKQWQHDLHETVNKPPSPVQKPAPRQSYVPTQSADRTSSQPPNRSLSTTTVLGNVPVNVDMPGLNIKIAKTMVKKHYTLLPQHRPPLRRDKPVRISIPEEQPRYIFPSIERSFIFIPRAMRPNQVYKNRGRGSFHASRRPSIYGASMYTPSVGMSRRPSVAASLADSGNHTPVVGHFPMHQPQQPIVRMLGSMNSFQPAQNQNMDVFYGDNAAIVHSPPSNLPMHQPRPYKAVSVDQIESPTRAVVPSQQPFHQQIPQELQQNKMPHIPEGAVYAQPFQPYGGFPQQQFYPIQYSQMPESSYPYGAENAQAGAAVPHESNGMVYYYDPNQQFMTPPMMMGVVPPGGGYYYPAVQNQMFYQ